ncbi:MAG: hypothetical protein LDL07_04395 [Desulfarculus sp.]|nr:hypothetical protein [Desulfarculus sp.]
MMEIQVNLTDLATLGAEFAARSQRARVLGLLAVESASVEEAPVRTSNLRSAITTNAAEGLVYVSGAAPYARYVHEGTGLYGPRRERIKPKTKKALMWPGAIHPVASVAGIHPNPFMDRGAARSVPRVVQAIDEAFA